MIQNDPEIYLQAAKMFTYFGLAFLIAMWLSPFLIALLKGLKFWKKTSRKMSATGEKLTVTAQFYKENEENEDRKKTPRAGGILIWVTTLLLALIFWVALKIDPDDSLIQFLNFVDRRETFIPLGALFFSALLGLADDILVVLPTGGNYFAGGLRLSQRAGGVAIISFLVGLWFHLKIGDKMHTITLPWWNSVENGWYKLNLENISLPFTFLDNFLQNSFGWDMHISNGGWLIIPITLVVLMSLWGSSIIDGFDGLAAGTLIPVYFAFAGLAFAQSSYDIATFLAVITGALVAYLWFNIPPAKFYMGDTGSLSLLIVIGVVAMLLDKIYILPIVGLILYITLFSAIIQIFSKKVFKKKVFLAAPYHHHLEAKGWERNQVTMRFWLISIITSILGFAMGIIIV